jgi:TM2 domain-containing membrane protein YozV
MSFCTSCGKEMDENWNSCPECGTVKNQGVHIGKPVNVAPQPQQVVVMQQAPKSMGVAMLLNFIWPGAGHMYLDSVKGGVYAITTLVCVLTSFLILPIIPLIVIWIGCMVKTPSLHRKYLVQKGFDSEQVVV